MSRGSRARRRVRGGFPQALRTGTYIALILLPSAARALHHMKRAPVHYVPREDDDRPLVVSNQCPGDIWPGIGTQSGTAPDTNGFYLAPGDTKSLSVSANWQGRVWGRTNCSFNEDGSGPGNSGGVNGFGQACATGDCAGVLDCKITGMTPVSLAEFTLLTSNHQDFYDISLVDGYNLPIAIIALFPQADDPNLNDVPPNLTNPVCIGTASLLGGDQDATLNSNSSYPIPLEEDQTQATVANWCPWSLQLDPPQKPGDGVYPYPDDNIPRPPFPPCYSACSKSNAPEDCCTGNYGSPDSCKPSEYSTAAKAVCPDAYSFAFDDQTSTFIVPSGVGYEVVFCAPGRSTKILSTLGNEMRTLASTGKVPKSLASNLRNATYVKEKSAAPSAGASVSVVAALTCAILVVMWVLV